MEIRDDLRYTEEHEWVRFDDDGTVAVGITHYAQEQLGDVVFVDLPEPGRGLAAGETFGAVESVKTASDLFAPVAGVVAEVNETLVDRPELVNEDPYDEGWMIVIEAADGAETDVLLTAEQYEQHLGE